jgi:hypothetical protein
MKGARSGEVMQTIYPGQKLFSRPTNLEILHFTL